MAKHRAGVARANVDDDVAMLAGAIGAAEPDREVAAVAQFFGRVGRLRARVDDDVPRPARRHILERVPEHRNEGAAAQRREEIL